MVKVELYSLPKDIYAIYEKVLSNIPETDKILARESLFLVAGALRPLTIMEVAEATVIEPDDTRVDEETRLPDPGVLLEICQGLIAFDKTTFVATLAHSSVRSFLTSERIGNGKMSWWTVGLSGIHQELAQKCLTYLLLEHFRGGCSEDGELEKRYKDYPFLRYASRYWPLHTRLAADRVRFDTSAMDLFLSHTAPDGGNFSSWVQCLMPDASKEMIMASEPLYYAASFGLTDLAKSLLTSKRVNIDAMGGRHRSSALHVTCYRGHLEIARHLLECGADINAADEDGATPLFWAEKMGRKEIIDLLTDQKYSHSGGRTVLALSKTSENIDDPFWFCCHCNAGPNRGRFVECWQCEKHERCDKCIKMARNDPERTPESQSRWMCCNCESGPSRVEMDECRDCEHKKCRRCWTFSISV
jgi:hypothetical protein